MITFHLSNQKNTKLDSLANVIFCLTYNGVQYHSCKLKIKTTCTYFWLDTLVISGKDNSRSTCS